MDEAGAKSVMNDCYLVRRWPHSLHVTGDGHQCVELCFLDKIRGTEMTVYWRKGVVNHSDPHFLSLIFI